MLVYIEGYYPDSPDWTRGHFRNCRKEPLVRKHYSMGTFPSEEWVVTINSAQDFQDLLEDMHMIGYTIAEIVTYPFIESPVLQIRNYLE